MNEIIRTEILDDDKEAILNNEVAILTKVIVVSSNDLEEIILTENDSVKDWEYKDERYVPNNGFIGQFVARTLTGNLQDIADDFNIENREIELRIGLKYLSDDSESWYSLGNFYVTKPENNEVNDNTKFEAMDYSVNFNQEFNANYISTTYETSFNDTIASGGYFTALKLAQYVCEQVGVEFGNLSFTQSSFVINSNQFTEGNSCRDVMKEISKLAYGWCSIHWDNKCYIDEPIMGTNNISEYDVIDNDKYYSLATQRKFMVLLIVLCWVLV